MGTGELALRPDVTTEGGGAGLRLRIGKGENGSAQPSGPARASRAADPT